MTALPLKIQEQLGKLHRREEAQDGFEYLLIVGGVSVAIVIAIAVAGPGLLGTVIDWVEAEIAAIP